MTITRNPVMVAGLSAAQQLAWVLFALPNSAFVDRADRRLAMAGASVIRAAALGMLAVFVFTRHASMPLLHVIFFVVGCAGLVFENASTAVLPALVERSGLEPFLFAVFAWVPFLLDAWG